MHITRLVRAVAAVILLGALPAPLAWGSPSSAPLAVTSPAVAAVATPTILSVSPTADGMVVGVRAPLGSTVTAQAILETAVAGTSAAVPVDDVGDAFLTISGLIQLPHTVTVTATLGSSTSTAATAGPVHIGWLGGGGDFVPVGPIRAYDSRTTAGGPWGPGEVRTVASILGHAGVPAQGVAAVAIAISAVGPTSAGYLTAWPSSEAKPLATAVNFAPWQTKTSLMKMPVGSLGGLSIYNHAGSVHVTLDVVGFYIDNSGTFMHNASFQSVSPHRVYDSRPLDGGPGPLAANGTVDVQVVTQPPLSADSYTAVELQVEAIDPSAEGYFTVWAAGAPRPVVSNVLFLKNTTVTSVIAPLSADGRISIFSNVSSGLAIDLTGIYSPAAQGRFHAVQPTRVYDTRDGIGTFWDAERRILSIGGQPAPAISPVPSWASSVVFSATAVNNTGATYLTFFPGNQTLPTAAMLVPSGPNQLNDNLVGSWLGWSYPFEITRGTLAAYNHAGKTDLVLDINGYYTDEAMPVSTETGVIGRIRDATSAPVKGVPVMRGTPGQFNYSARTVTDPTGMYGMKTGGESVVCTDGTDAGGTGFVGQCFQTAPWPTLEPYVGDPVSGLSGMGKLDFTLTTGAAIAGTFTYAGNDQPLANAQIVVLDSGRTVGWKDGYTDANGGFKVTGLPGGPLAICFLPYPWNPHLYGWDCVDVTTTTGATTPLNVGYGVRPTTLTPRLTP